MNTKTPVDTKNLSVPSRFVSQAIAKLVVKCTILVISIFFSGEGCHGNLLAVGTHRHAIEKLTRT